MVYLESKQTEEGVAPPSKDQFPWGSRQCIYGLVGGYLGGTPSGYKSSVVCLTGAQAAAIYLYMNGCLGFCNVTHKKISTCAF